MARQRRRLLYRLISFIVISGSSQALAANKQPEALAYPCAEKTNVSDLYHGVRIADPYRWLEETNSRKTRQWIAGENAVTRAFLQTSPQRALIAERLKRLWNYGRCDVPRTGGQSIFYTKNNGLQDQSVLYVQKSHYEQKACPRVLIDPNKLSLDGTVNLANFEASRDGRYVAYGLSVSGSDWEDWHVMDVASGRILPDHLHWLKNASVAWAPDSSGVYYSRYDEPKSTNGKYLEANYFNKVFYHRLGTKQSSDLLVYARKDRKEWEFNPLVTDDGRFLLIIESHGTSPKNGVCIKDLSDRHGNIVELVAPGTAAYDFIGNDKSDLFFVTDKDAPKGKIIVMRLSEDRRRIAQMHDVVRGGADALLNASYIDGKFLCHYLSNACSAVSVFDRSGKLKRELKLPGMGSVRGFGGRQQDKSAYYSYTSFVAPARVFRLSMDTLEPAVIFAPEINFRSDDFLTEQIFCRSKDGTRIPIFLSYRKGLVRNGDNPTYLYGYGGFKISMTPTFSPSNLLWMEKGGVYAAAVLRGGGEYGESWHEAGMRLKKQNVFDDFVAAAQELIDRGYTSTPKLAIGGGSNGGLLVGSCITQRPELFGAAVAAVGVMDMLRFNQFTVGWEWEQEYGSPKNEREFAALRRYSPLHNVQEGTCYPATLITTGDHDDRVVPGHSFKFAAALQSAQACDKPVLIRIDTRAGHGHGKSTSKLIEESADKWTFLLKTLNHDIDEVAPN